jgi:predicted DCC family thiol-disulfide oxidoreductase YuxK
MNLSAFGDNKKLFHKILISKRITKYVEIKDLLPLMIYDDSCYYCSKFANIVKTLARKRILIIGQYSKIGMEIKSEIFPKNYEATRMFWFINDKIAYGGRAGILPLLLFILKGKRLRPILRDVPLTDGTNCKTPETFFSRIITLLSNSERIILK